MGNAMTDLNSELNSKNRELRSEELTIDELDSVSGGRMKIPGKVVTAAEIAKLAADNPGFV
jgi:bacteriocin-like protein